MKEEKYTYKIFYTYIHDMYIHLLYVHITCLLYPPINYEVFYFVFKNGDSVLYIFNTIV